MFEFVTFSAEKLQTFLLVILRTSGLFLLAPVFSHSSIPVLVKAGFAILMAILLVPVASQAAFPQIVSVWQLALFAAKELLIGVIIGLFFSLVFYAVRITGNVVGYQVGLFMANIFDPNSGSQFSLVSEIYYLLTLILFIAIDGHHAVISALADSYKLIPVGVFNFSGGAGELLIKFSAYVFTAAIKIGAPVIITLFITEVALGVVARTVPQMNIFLVGIPLKIGVGLLVMATSLPVFRYMIEQTIGYLDREVLTVLYSIGTT